MNFPTSVELNNYDLTTVPRLRAFAYQLADLCPVGTQVRWEQAVPDIGRYVSVVATGTFINIYINEGSGVGTYVYEITIRRDGVQPDLIYHLGIWRSGRPLKKSDRQYMYDNNYDDYGGAITPHIKNREYAWNRMFMTDNGFMGGR